MTGLGARNDMAGRPAVQVARRELLSAPTYWLSYQVLSFRPELSETYKPVIPNEREESAFELSATSSQPSEGRVPFSAGIGLL